MVRDGKVIYIWKGNGKGGLERRWRRAVNGTQWRDAKERGRERAEEGMEEGRGGRRGRGGMRREIGIVRGYTGE